jgi:hypothetical protein
MFDCCRADAVEQLGAGDKRHAKASGGEQDSTVSRIVLQIMHTALDRADGDGIGDQERFQACLDGEEPADLAECRHKLSKRQVNGAVPPFPD